MLKTALSSVLAPALVLAALAGSATAQEGYRDRYRAPPAPAARYYGPVNNYYAPVTIYAAPDGGYATAPAYPAYGNAYGYGAGPATAPECDANCYGAGYDWSHGYGYGYGGYGAAYPAYGYVYPPANDAARLSPWHGYNGGFGNGYW